jgi:peptide/nickel transport system substrate-binding protein
VPVIHQYRIYLTRGLAFYFLLGAIIILSACAQEKTDALRFGLSSAPITLDPRLATDATSSRINRLLYRRLVDFDDASQPVPELATWEIITPEHYRFTLGKVTSTFTNGQILTAKDVKATYDYILDEKNASPHRSSLSMIKRIEAPNDNTIDFYLKHPDALFPGYLVIGIMPKLVVESGVRVDRNPVGSGPFVFLDWPDDGLLRLQRRKDQQVFEFIHVADATVRVLKLLRGEIDMLQNDLPRELTAYLARKKQIKVERAEGSNFTYIGFNMQDPVLKNREIRMAIAHAINRKELVQYMLGGQTRLANALLPPTHWAGNPAIKGYAYDPEKARYWLQKNGYSQERPLTISYKTSNDPFRIRIATVIQRQLAEVGINVTLRSFDWATFYGDIKSGRFQMYSLSWVGIKSPDIFKYVFHSRSVPPQGANRGRFSNSEVDHLITIAENSEKMTERASIYRQLQSLLSKLLPIVPLWYEEHFFASSKNVTGYTLATDGNYDGLITATKTM